MSKDESVDLDGDALALLAMYREQERPSDEVKGRVWERIEANPAAAMPVGAPAATGRTARWIGLGLAVAAALAVAVIGVGSGRSTAESSEESSPNEAALQHQTRESGGQAHEHEPAGEPRRRRTDKAAVPQPTPEPEPIPEPEPELTSEAEPEPALKPTTKRRPKSTAPVEPATPETLAAETSLLRRARAALAAKNAGSCLALLSQHAKQFPTGVLAEERDALRVVALCSDGRLQDGKRAAAKFRKAHPGSPLTGRVGSACTDEEKTTKP